MIHRREDLFQRIRDHKFGVECGLDYKLKVNLLENAVDTSIKTICEAIGANQEVHLGYSGGVDSSLVLVKLLHHLGREVPLVAHTIGSRDDLPDIVHARRFIEALKNEHSNLSHMVKIMQPSEHDIEKSNEILGVKKNRPDTYFMLMKAVMPHTRKLVCCDCIDELAGGYYAHRDPQKLPVYDSEESVDENRAGALRFFISKLVENHLRPLDAFSSAFGVEIFLPYGTKGVMDCATIFTVGELVDDNERKKPIYVLAKKNGVSKEILERRKYGLVNAFEQP